MTRNTKAQGKAKIPQTQKQKKKAPKSTQLPMLVSRPKPGRTQMSGFIGNSKVGLTNRIPQFLIAQTDPFAPEAFGVKIPDDSTAPSAVAFSRDLFPISIGATFAGAGMAFRHASFASTVTPIPTSSTSWTWPAIGTVNAVSNAAALQANFTLLRTAAYGIKIVTRQSAFSAAGFVHIALVPEAIGGSLLFTYPTNVGQMEYAPYYRRIPIADLIYDDILVPGRYTDHTGFRYLSPSLNDTGGALTPNIPSSGWLVLLVWVEAPGLSIANALDIEVLHHYEGLVMSSANGGVIEITRAAPTSPAILAATSYAIDRTEPIQDNCEDGENRGSFWNDSVQLFGVGLKIASGFYPALQPANLMYDMLNN